ncbi:hypothetical protein HYH02_007265 [Chlamydomonas schloesseri]|uniref:Uncharacterized protein n=1 Tax=Chlamydomonas schloesseri TaxID=2026947 RepID=A0A835WHU0_9CHLO|nr:hypothetical protein HYH02_007265 [Chlamydomonas schloesseri]|eukprot:KAG2447808.1 hypothetical protein HYH02_007265 [Chlamydomonas schloesseri]
MDAMAGMEMSAPSPQEHNHGHGMFFCDGEPVMTEGGSWIGHFMPGVVFLLWGAHWMQGIYRKYFDSRRPKGPEYRAQTVHGLGRVPAYVESWCKAFLPMIAISLELYFAHKGGWRTMVCPAGTPRAGHFYGPHMGNWQHASMYPPFILAGLVDLVGYEVELPVGTQQVFLFMAFVCETLLMALHKKHTPLDTAVHSVLMYTMAVTALFVLLELVQPRNFLISCGRVFGMLLQSAWFFAATHIMFDNAPFWDEAEGADMGPAMFVPVVFVALIVAVLAAMMLVFLGFNTYYKIRDAQGAQAAYERAGLLDDEPHHHHHRHTAAAATGHCGAGTVSGAAPVIVAVPLSTFASTAAASSHGGANLHHTHAHGTSCQV